MKLFFVICVIKVAWGELSNSFNFEANSVGLGRRIFPRINRSNFKYLPVFDTVGRPDPLPPPKRSHFAAPNYHNLTQGTQLKGNRRVYNQRFNYPPRSQGQQLFFRGDYNCILSRIAVHTVGCMATLLRGGVGYRYFLVLVRAKPDVRLQGRVRAWCRNASDEYLGAW